MTDDPNARLKEVLLNAATSAISREGRAEILTQLTQAIINCDTMVRGLPNVVEALEADVEEFRLKLGAMLRSSAADVLEPDDRDTVREMGEDLFSTVKPFLKSMQTLAKGQLAMAKYTRLLCLVTLIGVSSDDFMVDAAKLSNKLGGDGLKELFKAKFGEKL